MPVQHSIFIFRLQSSQPGNLRFKRTNRALTSQRFGFQLATVKSQTFVMFCTISCMTCGTGTSTKISLIVRRHLCCWVCGTMMMPSREANLISLLTSQRMPNALSLHFMLPAISSLRKGQVVKQQVHVLKQPRIFDCRAIKLATTEFDEQLAPFASSGHTEKEHTPWHSRHEPASSLKRHTGKYE